MNYLRPLLPAILLAPWMVVPFVVISGLGTSDAGVVSDFGWGLFFAIIIAVPLAYVGVLCLGVPCYLLLRRFNLASSWLLCTVGFAVPFCLSIGDPRFDMTLLFGACGAAVALTAWLLLPRQLASTFSAKGSEE